MSSGHPSSNPAGELPTAISQAEWDWVKSKFEFLDHLPVGSCVLRQDCVILYWNRRLEEWTQCRWQTVVGSAIGDHFPLLKQSKYASRLETVFGGGPPVIFSSQLHQTIFSSLAADAQQQIQHTTVTAVPNWDKTGYYALVFVQDVTDLTQRIQAYREMRDQALREVEERRQIEQQIQQKSFELEQRNRELTQLTRMSELLQACVTLKEAAEVIALEMKVLFPNFAGSLFWCQPDHQALELAASWGSLQGSTSLFSAQECWALRLGKPHLVNCGDSTLQCQHIEGSLTQYACIPLIAQGEALGLLFFCTDSTDLLDANRQILAVNTAEHLSLALANIRLRETLQHQSIRDPLTGLYNRRYMEDALEREIHRAERNQTFLSVIMLDVDYFKRINDSLGHAVGDQVLRYLGQFLLKQVRTSDIVCRYGGEEIVLILPDTPLIVAEKRAEQIRETIKTFPSPSFTISAGVAVFPRDGVTGEALLQAADAALYRAKLAGRDRVMVAGS